MRRYDEDFTIALVHVDPPLDDLSCATVHLPMMAIQSLHNSALTCPSAHTRTSHSFPTPIPASQALTTSR